MLLGKENAEDMQVLRLANSSLQSCKPPQPAILFPSTAKPDQQ